MNCEPAAETDLGLQRASRHMNCLVQVIARSFELQFGPEQFHNLFSVVVVIRQKN